MKKLFILLMMLNASDMAAQQQQEINIHPGLSKTDSSIVRFHKLLSSGQMRQHAANKTLSIKHVMDSVVTQAAYYSASLTNYEKKAYSFNNSAGITSYILSEYDTTSNQWDSVVKLEATYSAGLFNLGTFYNKDINTSQWTSAVKEIYAYDVNGNRTEEIDSVFQSNVWTPVNKYTYSYNTANQATKEVSQTWDYNNNQWANFDSVSYTYNSNGHRSAYTYSYWDSGTNSWITSDKLVYESTTGKPQLAYYITWNSGLSIFDTVIKFDIVYDATGNPVSETYSTNQGIGWTPSYKLAYTFDTNIPLSDVVYYPYDLVALPGFYLRNEIESKVLSASSFIYNPTTSSWDSNDSSTYYYSQKDLAVNDKIITQSTTIYPNPAKDVVSFNISNNQPATVRIYNAAGQIVLAQQVRSKTPIAVSNLTRGMYLYTITQGAATESGKLMLK